MSGEHNFQSNENKYWIGSTKYKEKFKVEGVDKW